jgi:hypothetical protein
VAGKIFINYRRDDSAPHALSVSQYLERAFGPGKVFIDIDRIRAGQKFPEVLERRLADCKVMVTVIGRNWLDARGDDGRRRLDDPSDWVRLEIVRALARDITVIPVTVGGAELPKKSDLPEELRPLLDYHAVAITTNGFRSDMAGLLNDIRAIPAPSSWWPRIRVGLAASVALASVIWGALYLRGPPAPGTVPAPKVESPEPQHQPDEDTPQGLLKERIAVSDRAELIDLIKQNPAKRSFISAKLGTLGYVSVATATAGESRFCRA